MEKRKVKFTKEGRYSLHPAFGPTIDVIVGDEYTFDKHVVDQIVDDEWGEIIEDEVEEDLEGSDDLDDGDFVDPNLEDSEVKWPTVILTDFVKGEIDEEEAKKLLMERSKDELDMDLNHMKSVANMVTEILIEMEIQEENDD